MRSLGGAKDSSLHRASHRLSSPACKPTHQRRLSAGRPARATKTQGCRVRPRPLVAPPCLCDEPARRRPSASQTETRSLWPSRTGKQGNDGEKRQQSVESVTRARRPQTGKEGGAGDCVCKSKMAERKIFSAMMCVWLMAVLLLQSPVGALRRPAQPLLRSVASRKLRCSSQIEATTERIKVPIGSAPEFAIAGDSTVETPYQRAVVGVHFLISALNLYSAGTHLLPTVASPLDFIPLVLTVLLSTVLGDLGTGIFHWSVDNYGDIKTPVFGAVCVAFQGHHDTPWTITFRSFCNNVFKIAYGTIPALLLLPVLINDSAPLVKIFFTLFINWWLISQEFHKWAHMRTPPSPVVKFLQDSGVILSRREHGLHHTSPFEGHYCILTGICNPILDKTKFFRHLERLVFKITGNESNTWKADATLRSAR